MHASTSKKAAARYLAALLACVPAAAWAGDSTAGPDSAYDYLQYSLVRQGMDGVGGKGPGWGLGFSHKLNDTLFAAGEWDEEAMSAEFTGVSQHRYTLTLGARTPLSSYFDLVGEASLAHLRGSTDFYSASKYGYVLGVGLRLYPDHDLQFDAFLRRTSLGLQAGDLPLNTFTTFGQTTANFGLLYRLDEHSGLGVDYLRGSGNGLHALMFVVRGYF